MSLIQWSLLYCSTKMKLFSDFHTSKNWVKCYKKYRAHRCCGNFGITKCTTAKLTKNLHDISEAAEEEYLNWNTICLLQIIANHCLWTNITFDIYDICQYERLENRELGSNIKIIPKIHLYVTEHWSLHFSNKKCAQFEFTYRVITEGINVCDIGWNTNKIKKQTINLLSEHQRRSNSKLRVSYVLWKFSC